MFFAKFFLFFMFIYIEAWLRLRDIRINFMINVLEAERFIESKMCTKLS